jgi:hypothetical protein
MRVKWEKAYEKFLEDEEIRKLNKIEAMKKRKRKIYVRNNHIDDFVEEFEEVAKYCLDNLCR